MTKKNLQKKNVEHVNLSLWADLFLIAPATANTISEISSGAAHNIVSTTALSMRAPTIISPAMDFDMYLNPITQNNLQNLKERGFFILPPSKGELASGLFGEGRLPEPEKIVEFLIGILKNSHQDLKKKNILITAGPTFEPIDSVRFIGNRSSGKMGFALSNAAALRGANVTLIAGPVKLETPKNVKRINVETAEEMNNAVLTNAKNFDAIIMSAAVSDFAPIKKINKKIKKHTNLNKIEVKKTDDILAGLKNYSLKKIGFALETDNEIVNAKEKLKNKKLDFIILNSLKDEGVGFGLDTNKITIIDKKMKIEKFPILSKFDTANEILNRVSKIL